jgi:hypothetical protein
MDSCYEDIVGWVSKGVVTDCYNQGYVKGFHFTDSIPYDADPDGCSRWAFDIIYGGILYVNLHLGIYSQNIYAVSLDTESNCLKWIYAGKNNIGLTLRE